MSTIFGQYSSSLVHSVVAVVDTRRRRQQQRAQIHMLLQEEIPGEGPVGFMSFYWISEFEGENTWGTLDKPIFKTRVHFDALKKEPAWIGTSAQAPALTTQPSRLSFLHRLLH